MIVYLPDNVLEAAKKRIRFIFDEFPEVVVAFSGGKDSTACLFLTLDIARELNRLPLEVWFIDQEAEWQGTVDYCRYIRSLPDINFVWFQMPIQIFNATSHTSNWLWCWKDGDEHMREKEPGAVTENTFKTTRFKKLFTNIPLYLKQGQKVAVIGGVRAEESPARKLGLTEGLSYKHITWGSKNYVRNDGYSCHTMYPIYDWSYSDIWKYIHENNIPYNTVYDEMFRYGVDVMKMRISNLNHETALDSMLLVQEIEPDTWNKLVSRIEGVNSASQLKANLRCPKELPHMFADWKEYRDYLTEHLTKSPERELFQKMWATWDKKAEGMPFIEGMHKVQITAVLLNDYHFTVFENWRARIDVMDWFRFKAGKWHPRFEKNKFIINGL